jgi:hypothetical protein
VVVVGSAGGVVVVSVSAAVEVVVRVDVFDVVGWVSVDVRDVVVAQVKTIFPVAAPPIDTVPSRMIKISPPTTANVARS